MVSTLRADGSAQASVVNAGVIAHPLTGEDAVAFVGMGGSVKLRNLRRDSRITVVLRVGFRWMTVEGEATLIGPDGRRGRRSGLADGLDLSRLVGLLRGVFLSTGATHDDWAEYDRVMAAERRCCVFVAPLRVYGVG